MQMGHPRVRLGRTLTSALLCAVLTLSGCGGGDSGSVATIGSTPTASNTTVPPAKPAATNWTTLGTRATPAQPGTSITTNASAKWVDYNPPVLYAGIARQATQYITMPDGTKLAAYVTLPADASGNPATGAFPTVLVQTLQRRQRTVHGVDRHRAGRSRPLHRPARLCDGGSGRARYRPVARHVGCIWGG